MTALHFLQFAFPIALGIAGGSISLALSWRREIKILDKIVKIQRRIIEAYQQMGEKRDNSSVGDDSSKADKLSYH